MKVRSAVLAASVAVAAIALSPLSPISATGGDPAAEPTATEPTVAEPPTDEPATDEPTSDAPVPPPPGGDPATLAAAEAIDEANDSVLAATDGFPGYASAESDTASRTLTIRWEGDVPPGLAKLAETGVGDVTIKVVPAAYSEADIQAAGKALLLSSPDDVRPASVGGRPDRSGLIVYVPETTTARRGVSALEKIYQEIVTAELPYLADMPIDIKNGEQVIPG